MVKGGGWSSIQPVATGRTNPSRPPYIDIGSLLCLVNHARSEVHHEESTVAAIPRQVLGAEATPGAPVPGLIPADGTNGGLRHSECPLATVKGSRSRHDHIAAGGGPGRVVEVFGLEIGGGKPGSEQDDGLLDVEDIATPSGLSRSSSSIQPTDVCLKRKNIVKPTEALQDVPVLGRSGHSVDMLLTRYFHEDMSQSVVETSNQEEPKAFGHAFKDGQAKGRSLKIMPLPVVPSADERQARTNQKLINEVDSFLANAEGRVRGDAEAGVALEVACSDGALEGGMLGCGCQGSSVDGVGGDERSMDSQLVERASGGVTVPDVTGDGGVSIQVSGELDEEMLEIQEGMCGGMEVGAGMRDATCGSAGLGEESGARGEDKGAEHEILSDDDEDVPLVQLAQRVTVAMQKRSSEEVGKRPLAKEVQRPSEFEEVKRKCIDVTSMQRQGAAQGKRPFGALESTEASTLEVIAGFGGKSGMRYVHSKGVGRLCASDEEGGGGDDDSLVYDGSDGCDDDPMDDMPQSVLFGGKRRGAAAGASDGEDGADDDDDDDEERGRSEGEGGRTPGGSGQQGNQVSRASPKRGRKVVANCQLNVKRPLAEGLELRLSGGGDDDDRDDQRPLSQWSEKASPSKGSAVVRGAAGSASPSAAKSAKRASLSGKKRPAEDACPSPGAKRVKMACDGVKKNTQGDRAGGKSASSNGESRPTQGSALALHAGNT